MTAESKLKDETATLATLKRIAQDYCEARDWDQYHDAKELAMSMVIEAAELLELFRFQRAEDIPRILQAQREEVSDELGDVLFAMLRFCQLYDIDLAAAYGRKMAKNERKYPVEKARGSNKKYDEF